jgi:hypothetical protein
LTADNADKIPEDLTTDCTDNTDEEPTSIGFYPCHPSNPWCKRIPWTADVAERADKGGGLRGFFIRGI